MQYQNRPKANFVNKLFFRVQKQVEEIRKGLKQICLRTPEVYFEHNFPSTHDDGGVEIRREMTHAMVIVMYVM